MQRELEMGGRETGVRPTVQSWERVYRDDNDPLMVTGWRADTG